MGIKIEKIERFLPKYKITSTGIVLITNKVPVSQETSKDVLEGGIKEIIRELSYRNPQLRSKAITENGGYFCFICGFDFEAFYGDAGKNIIEVHHKIPLSDGERMTTTKELAVVCANCHRVIHHKEEQIDVNELKKIIEERRKLKKNRIDP